MHDQHRAVLRAAVLPLAVTAITLRSLAHPGYLVQIDSAYGLRTVPVDCSFYSPVRLLTVLGQTLVGGAITGRIYVCLALFLCGFSAMILLRTQPWWAQGAGGLLAMLNPFVYDRLVEGQWSIVVATAGLLFVVAAWLSLRHSPRPVAAIWLALSILLTLAFSADFAGILLLLVAGLALYASAWRSPAFRRWTLAAGAGAVALCAYGVLGFFGLGAPADVMPRAREAARKAVAIDGSDEVLAPRFRLALAPENCVHLHALNGVAGDVLQFQGDAGNQLVLAVLDAGVVPAGVDVGDFQDFLDVEVVATAADQQRGGHRKRSTHHTSILTPRIAAPRRACACPRA